MFLQWWSLPSHVFSIEIRKEWKIVQVRGKSNDKQQLNSVTYIINSSFNSSFNSRFLHVGIGFRNEVKDISTRLKHSPLKVVKETIVLFLLEVLSILIYFYELSLFFKSFFFCFSKHVESLFVVNFVIHWNKTAMGLHVFPIPIPPPTSLSTRSP